MGRQRSTVPCVLVKKFYGQTLQVHGFQNIWEHLKPISLGQIVLFLKRGVIVMFSAYLCFICVIPVCIRIYIAGICSVCHVIHVINERTKVQMLRGC
jgi:hypothetical protein